jgi:hypothetical protein
VTRHPINQLPEDLDYSALRKRLDGYSALIGTRRAANHHGEASEIVDMAIHDRGLHQELSSASVIRPHPCPAAHDLRGIDGDCAPQEGKALFEMRAVAAATELAEPSLISQCSITLTLES